MEFVTLTSNFKAFHSLRADALANAEPYTGKLAERAWSVSICDQFQYGIGWIKENIKLTFVAREPAVSLSRNTGIAKGPKLGVAFKAPL